MEKVFENEILSRDTDNYKVCLNCQDYNIDRFNCALYDEFREKDGFCSDFCLRSRKND